MATKILTRSHLCIPFLDNKCTIDKCFNYHPTTPEQIKIAKSEVKLKYSDAFKMNKICILFNQSNGCKHNPCKFLHIEVDKNPKIQKPQYGARTESTLSNFVSVLENMNRKIAGLEALQMTTSSVYKVPQEVYEMRDHYYTQLELLSNSLLMDVSKIPDI